MELIKKYALAQYYLGVNKTLWIKNSISKKPLDEWTRGELEQLIRRLRDEYRRMS